MQLAILRAGADDFHRFERPDRGIRERLRLPADLLFGCAISCLLALSTGLTYRAHDAALLYIARFLCARPVRRRSPTKRCFWATHEASLLNQAHLRAECGVGQYFPAICQRTSRGNIQPQTR